MTPETTVVLLSQIVILTWAWDFGPNNTVAKDVKPDAHRILDVRTSVCSYERRSHLVPLYRTDYPAMFPSSHYSGPREAT